MDPRRRLQVLQSSSPSLRVATAPKQSSLSVGVAQQQPLYVNTGNQTLRVNQSPGARTSSVAEQQQLSQPQHNFGLDDVVKSIGHIGADLARPVVATGLNWAQTFGNLGTELGGGKAQTGSEFWSGPTAGVAKFAGNGNANDLGTTRNIIGNAAQVGSYILPGAAETKGLGLGAKVGIDALGGALANDAYTFTNDKNATLGDYLRSTAIGGVAGGGLRLGFAGAGAIKNKVIPSAKSVGLSKGELQFLKNATDPEQIHTFLSSLAGGSSDALRQLSQEIAGTQSKREIIKAIADLPIESLAASGASALASNQLAKQRYGESPLTGESKPRSVVPKEQPLENIWIGPGDPPPGWNGGATLEGGTPQSIPLTGTALDKPLPQSQIDEALKAAGVQEADTNLRFSPIKENSAKIAKDGKFAKTIVRGADSSTSDSLDTVINSLAKTPNKNEVRNVITELFKDSRTGKTVLDGNDLNRLVKSVTEKTDPTVIKNELNQALQTVDAKAAAQAAEPHTGKAVTEQQIAQAAPDSGAVATEIAPNGATVTKAEKTAQNAPESVTVADTVNKNADQAANDFSAFDPETQKVMGDIMKGLDNAKSAYKDVTKVRSQEKAARGAASDAAYEAAGGGEAGRRAALKALQGEYSKSGYIAPEIPQASKDKMFNAVQNSDLRSFEKRNTQTAFAKVFGDTEKKPTNADIVYIRKFLNKQEPGLGDTVAQEVQAVMEAAPKDWRQRIVDIAGVPRAAMASFDLSFGGRQGAPVAARSLPQWADANKESIKYAVNPKYYSEQMKKLSESDAYDLMTSKMGVRLPGVEGMSDEVMASANILEKVPVYGKGVAASDRAYSGGLTKLRYNLAKDWIDKLGGIDKFTKDFSDKEMKDIGEVINTFTGSGGKPGGITEKHMQTLATTLFAPRLWAANLNRLNPAFYARLSPVARKRALEYQASFFALAGSVLGLAAAAGATVVWDPRSADFAKIKVGNTRYDILGGQQQNIRFLGQMITGQKINSANGKLSTIGTGISPSRFDVAVDFAGNKLNPLLGFAKRQLEKKADGTDKYGNKTNTLLEAAQLLTPLNIQSAVDTYNDTGKKGQSVAMNLPGFVGFGAQTYGDTKTKDIGKPGNTLKQKITNAADAKQKQLDEFNAGLSPDETQLIGKSDKALQSLVDDGTIDKSMYRQIVGLKQARKNLQGVDIPDGVKSDPAKAFYKKYNSLTTEGQKKYLSSAPDQNSKDIATALNKTRPKGLGELKPSNKISQLYAEFEAKANSKDWTTVDQRNETKKLWTGIAKASRTQPVNDIYAEGPSSDLKTLIANGDVGQKDLDAAIQLDNELYAAGLTGKLKFTKKFRESYGYKTPAGSGGSSGSSKSKNAFLTSFLLPNSVGGTGIKVPKFSSRSRGIKFKAPSIGGASKPSKKININL